MSEPPPGQEPDTSDATGLPLLRTWPAVYTFVIVIFALWIVLLTIFGRAFS